jgi:hypothetical protein
MQKTFTSCQLVVDYGVVDYQDHRQPSTSNTRTHLATQLGNCARPTRAEPTVSLDQALATVDVSTATFPVARTC